MVRECGRGNTELLLDFARDHASRMGGKEETQDLQARFGAKRGEAVGGPGNEKWIRSSHISMIAEIWKNCNSLFIISSHRNVSLHACISPKERAQALETERQLRFDRVPAAWDTFSFWGYDELSKDELACSVFCLRRVCRGRASAGYLSHREKPTKQHLDAESCARAPSRRLRQRLLSRR